MLPPLKGSDGTRRQLDEVFSAREEPDDDNTLTDEWVDTEVQAVGPAAVAADNDPEDGGDVVAFETIEPGEEAPGSPLSSIEELQAAADFDPKPQGELLLEGGPKGRFEGQEPNLVEGEDLDIPPFLRRKK